MKKISLYALLTLAFLFSSCDFIKSGGMLGNALREHNNPRALQRMNERKRLTDSLYLRRKDQVQDYIKLRGEKEVQPLYTENFPDDVDTFFHVFRAGLGQVLMTSELTFNDRWPVSTQYYFDDEDRFFLLERSVGYMDSACSDALLYDILLEYYDAEGQQVHREHFIDGREKGELPADRCGYRHKGALFLPRNVGEYLRVRKIPE